MEIADTQKTKFKNRMIMKMIQDLKQSENARNVTKDLEELKNKQRWINTLEGTMAKDKAKAEEPISDLEDRNHCGNHSYKAEHMKKKKKNRNEGSLRGYLG